MIKNPILIHAIDSVDKLSERALKGFILDKIEEFLLELGIGFTYVGSEVKLGSHRCDLLFFNYELNSFVVIELKIRKLKPQDIGQIKYYMNYIDLKLYKKILYIGQETNCWFNYNNADLRPQVQQLEDYYYNFLNERCATNRDFWTFIRGCLDINRNELSKNIIWSNLFIAGKRTRIGAPHYTDSLANLSFENLFFLYNYFKPNAVIIVGGANNPYYKLTINFLKQLKSSLINSYPTLNDPLLLDDDKNIFWTYHPNYQNKKNIKVKIMNQIKNKLD